MPDTSVQEITPGTGTIPNTGTGRDRGSSPARGGGAPKERRGRNDTLAIRHNHKRRPPP